MVDLASIAGFAASLASLSAISRELIDLVGDKAASAKIIELNTRIMEVQQFALSAQSEQITLSDRVRELEQELIGDKGL